MIACSLSEANILPFLAELDLDQGASSVTVGCINSSDNVTLTGAEEQIDSLKIALEQLQNFTRKLKVDVAYHSSYMDTVAKEYEEVLTNLAPGCSLPGCLRVPMFSTVFGYKIRPERLRESDYWVRNLKFPVQFLDAISSMFSHSSFSTNGGTGSSPNETSMVDHVLEVGPHSALQGPVKEILQNMGKHETTGYIFTESRRVCIEI